MKILALEASAVAASVAICEEDKVIGEFFLQTGQTHSQTLMPMTQQILQLSGTSLGEMDYLAVATGPGSFTGLRIAIAAVKGMAMGAEKPCVPVSTLEALAYNMIGMADCLVSAVMDARCHQVYTALFSVHGGTVTRLWEDMAISIDELGEKLNQQEKPVFLVGDGAQMCYTILREKDIPTTLAPPHLCSQRAVSVAACAVAMLAKDIETAIPYDALLPSYLRLPQAERELLARQAKK